MRVHFKFVLASVAIAAATLCKVAVVRAQDTAPTRKSIAESSIAAPEYFGLYAVDSKGKTSKLKRVDLGELEKMQQMTEAAGLDKLRGLRLGKDVEFLLYGKEHKGAPMLLRVDQDDQETEKLTLLEKPLGGQPEMQRFIPEKVLAPGMYMLAWAGYDEQLQPQSYLFVVDLEQLEKNLAASSQQSASATGSETHPISKPGYQSARAPALEEHPAALNYREEKNGFLKPSIFATTVSFSGDEYGPAFQALYREIEASPPFKIVEADSKAGTLTFIRQPPGNETFKVAFKKSQAANGQSLIKMDMQLIPLIGREVIKNGAIKTFAEMMDVAKKATVPAASPVPAPVATAEQESQAASNPIAAVCPGGKQGAFIHGARCTGFYDEDGLVDLRLEGGTSTEPHTRTKDLVHAGVDIMATEGSPIFPIRDGVVVDVIDVDSDRNWKTLGYMVIVEHPGDASVSKYYSLYLHMKQKPTVKMGDPVFLGKTELGLVGHTGVAYGSHVHVEVRTFKDRFNSTWKNIYGKLTPESEKTFDEKAFETAWRDPLKFITP